MARVRDNGSSDANEKNAQQIQLPMYAIRQSPLIQPLRTSTFSDKIWAKFGVQDLGHEWVALFQILSGANDHHEKRIKLQIPDTILLSPCGQPSMWYSTTSSSKVKAKNLMLVTARRILQAFTPVNGHGQSNEYVAIRRCGFQTEMLTLAELEEFCHEMEHPSLLLPPERLDSTTSRDEPGQSPRLQKLSGRSFCLQRYVERQHQSTFIVVVRHKMHDTSTISAKDASVNSTEAISKQNQIMHGCDLFLLKHSSQGANGSEDDYEDNDHDRDLIEECRIQSELTPRLLPLNLESNDAVDKKLRMQGFDEDMVIPQLFHMKAITSEIMNRINRGLRTRLAVGIICEFFIGAYDQRVYFSALKGIHWEDHPPSWTVLRRVDTISGHVCDYYEKVNRRTESTHNRDGSQSQIFPIKLFSRQSHIDSIEDKLALRLYYELNPRFPSVQPLTVMEQQWKYQSSLLPPDLSPRYVGTGVPKTYRNGRFHPLLTPSQADSVNRLYLSPSHAFTTPTQHAFAKRPQTLPPKSPTRSKMNSSSSGRLRSAVQIQ